VVPQYNFQLQKGPECAGAYLKYWQEQVKVAHKPAIFQWNEAKVLSAVLSLDILVVELLLKP
jgi:hypothetical protein